MRTLRLSVVGVVLVALLGGLAGVVGAQEEAELQDEARPVAFPIGLFVSVENDELLLEYLGDGNGVHHDLVRRYHTPFTFAVDGDIYNWLSADPVAEEYGQPTYAWDYDGERLSFELVGEDTYPYRKRVYTENTYQLVEDPVEVVVAAQDIPAGSLVYSNWVHPRIVSAERAGPDAFTDFMDAIGDAAVVDIAKGTPITPDLLEPAAE